MNIYNITQALSFHWAVYSDVQYLNWMLQDVHVIYFFPANVYCLHFLTILFHLTLDCPVDYLVTPSFLQMFLIPANLHNFVSSADFTKYRGKALLVNNSLSNTRILLKCIYNYFLNY